MIRWWITGFIAAFAVMLTFNIRGSPYRPRADVPYELGVLLGSFAVPFAIGLIGAGLLSLVMKKSEGGFHRRFNVVALIAVVLAVAGQFAKKAL